MWNFWKKQHLMGHLETAVLDVSWDRHSQFIKLLKQKSADDEKSPSNVLSTPDVSHSQKLSRETTQPRMPRYATAKTVVWIRWISATANGYRTWLSSSNRDRRETLTFNWQTKNLTRDEQSRNAILHSILLKIAFLCLAKPHVITTRGMRQRLVLLGNAEVWLKP